jgi:peptidoglycan LD-endopeptidase LytH
MPVVRDEVNGASARIDAARPAVSTFMMVIKASHVSAYHAWLASAPPRAAILQSADRGPLAWGRLEDPELHPGAAPRAGGYGEDRRTYTSPLFASAGAEPRTVHLGLDLFAAAGTPVFAPLAGHIHSFADNARLGDYGPTLILEHAPAPHLRFHTLYGHLDRASLSGWRLGAEVQAGQRLGAMGERAENGDWPSHLHIQVIVDIGDHVGDYPGVCRRSERAHWLAICPDPTPFLGLRISAT